MSGPSLADALVTVGRLRLGLPTAEPDGVRPFYPDQLDDFWIVPLFAGDAGRVLVVHAPDGVVAAHAGLARAAARLAALGLLDRDAGWVAANLRALLDATGGLTPGHPRYAEEEATADADGVQLTVTAPEPWVRWAAGGAAGPPPGEGAGPGGPGGIAPPEVTGRMVGRLDRDGALSWAYELDGGAVVGRFTGAVADDGPDRTDPVTAESAVAAARAAVASPLAVPSAPVAPGAAGWRVGLLGHDPIEIEGS